jgi:hypothetical protein
MIAMRVARALLVLLVGAAVASCSNADEPDVRASASTFAGGDAEARCGLLAPATLETLVLEEETSCPEAIESLPLGTGDVVSVEVWGEDALVHLSDDTLFLTRDDGGWLVSAGACQPDGDGPYQCQLEAS